MSISGVQDVCLREELRMNRKTVLIKGAGEKGSAVAHGLHCAGITRIVMTDLPLPVAERRGVCFSEAIIEGRKQIQGVVAKRTKPSVDLMVMAWTAKKIAVLADPGTAVLGHFNPDVVIDGVMAKENTGTTIGDAPLVIALGPGFTAGKDCHLVVETNPASSLMGRVIFKGAADENTRMPTSVMGLTVERLIRSPWEGRLVSIKGIGERAEKGETIGYVDGTPVRAPISGCIWGLMRDGVRLKQGQKIGDMDPRGERKRCFEITPESRTIAHGVLRGIHGFDIKA